MKAFTANHANRYSRINRAWLEARGPRLSASWSPWYRCEYSASICWFEYMQIDWNIVSVEHCIDSFSISRCILFSFSFFFITFYQRLRTNYREDLVTFLFHFFFFFIEREGKNYLYLNRDRDVFLDRNSDRMWYRDWHFLGYHRDCLADRCSVTRISISSVSSIDSTFVLLRFSSLLFGQGCRHEGEDDEKLQERSNSNYWDSLAATGKKFSFCSAKFSSNSLYIIRFRIKLEKSVFVHRNVWKIITIYIYIFLFFFASTRYILWILGDGVSPDPRQRLIVKIAEIIAIVHTAVIAHLSVHVGCAIGVGSLVVLRLMR